MNFNGHCNPINVCLLVEFTKQQDYTKYFNGRSCKVLITSTGAYVTLHGRCECNARCNVNSSVDEKSCCIKTCVLQHLGCSNRQTSRLTSIVCATEPK